MPVSSINAGPASNPANSSNSVAPRAEMSIVTAPGNAAQAGPEAVAASPAFAAKPGSPIPDPFRVGVAAYQAIMEPPLPTTVRLEA